MSIHSYSRCWVHFTWGTLRREPVINKQAAAKLSKHLNEYAKDKGIYMKINYVNADHVHVLIDLPTKYSMEEVMRKFENSDSWNLPVLNNDEYIGFVSKSKIFSAYRNVLVQFSE